MPMMFTPNSGEFSLQHRTRADESVGLDHNSVRLHALEFDGTVEVKANVAR
jgi:hypothetical protein